MIHKTTLILILMFAATGLMAPAMSTEDTPPPSVMFAPFLNGMTIIHDTGEISFDTFYTMYLPDVEEYSYQEYSPSDGGELWAVISDSVGEELFRLDFYGLEDGEPYHMLTHYNVTDNRTGETAGMQDMYFEASHYSVDFFVEGEHFFHFPFTVSVVASPDPETRDDYFYLDGAWEDWSYFVYRDADPDEPLRWKVWLRDKTTDYYENYEVTAEVRRDGGGLVCTGREGVSYNLRPGWVRAEFDMIHPSDGSLFRAKDLLSNDGSYTMTLELNGELYGTWKFEISGGEFVYEGRTDRAVTDPLVFIEGGPGVFFYEKE